MSQYERETSRVSRSKAEAQALYDKISGWYDPLAGTWERRWRDLGLKKLGVREGERVLEIGFGTGHTILTLAQSTGRSGKVYGIDLSPRMVGIAQDRVDEAGLSERVVLRCGDAAQLPFETGCFNVIFMSFTLELFDTPEISEVLNECRRVLCGGGRMCVISLSKVGGSSRIKKLYEWGHKRFPRLLDCRPIFVQRSLERAGLHSLDAIQTSKWGLPIEIVIAREP